MVQRHFKPIWFNDRKIKNNNPSFSWAIFIRGCGWAFCNGYPSINPSGYPAYCSINARSCPRNNLQFKLDALPHFYYFGRDYGFY